MGTQFLPVACPSNVIWSERATLTVRSCMGCGSLFSTAMSSEWYSLVSAGLGCSTDIDRDDDLGLMLWEREGG